MKRRHRENLEMRLDGIIDALNAERAPLLFDDDDPELIGMVDTIRTVRQLREPAEADTSFPNQLVENVGVGLAHGGRVFTDGAIGTPFSEGIPRERRDRRLLLTQAGSTFRSLGIGVIAGAVAGLIAGGIGGRLVMRVSAMLYERSNPDAVAITESSGRIIGAFTWGGTADLLIEGMVNGVIGGLLFVLLRPWLPQSRLWQGLLYGLLLLALGGAVIIDSDNTDFRNLGSPGLNVVMFTLLFILFGLVLAPMAAFVRRVVSTDNAGDPKKMHAKVVEGVLLLAGLLSLPVFLLVYAGGLVLLIITAYQALRSLITDGDPQGLWQLALGTVFYGFAVLLPLAHLSRARTPVVFGRQINVAVYLVLGLATLVGMSLTLHSIISIITHG